MKIIISPNHNSKGLGNFYVLGLKESVSLFAISGFESEIASMLDYLRQRVKSFGYAFKGLATLVKTQPHARLHLLATVLVTGLGIYLEISRADWIALVLAMALVWAMEAVNTGIEFLTDLASPDYHPLAGKAKDVAAAAVLLAAIGAAIVAGLVFCPYFS